MPRFRVRTFQGRIALAILVVVLVPAAAAVAGGAYTLRTIGVRSGTLGAWGQVAETGQELLDAVERSGSAEPQVREAAERHRAALSESVRMSRLYTFLTGRVVGALPLAALAAGLALAALSLLTARRLARGFAAPVEELAGWTGRIARGEPLPPPDPSRPPPVEELGTLQTALRSMAAEIEEARRREVEHARMRSWTELARRVAHEIKNPLTPMRMAAATLARGRTGGEAEAAQVLQDEIRRLDEMARTFAQYGRIPEGPRSRVELEELLRSLALQHAAAEIPVRVEGGAVWVDGHFDALERAFRNLILNAVEAQSPGPGSVDIGVGTQGAEAVVRVEDRGPGIPEALLGSLWDPDVTTKSHGTGLGLALVRQTVHHHGGSVEAVNRDGGGASFVVRLPLAPPPPTADTPGRASP